MTDRKMRSEAIEKRKGLSSHIRWMIRRDMDAILDIERESFEFPWREEDFVRCLRQRNCIGMAAEYHDESLRGEVQLQVVGFMVYELTKTWIHLINFAVAPEFRHRGVGSQMAAKLVGKLSAQRRRRITLEVRESNLAAQLFFHSAGFRATAVLREYYDDTPDEDAYRMEYVLRRAECPADTR